MCQRERERQELANTPSPRVFTQGELRRRGELPQGRVLKLNHRESRTMRVPPPTINLGHATLTASAQKSEETLRE